MERYTQSEDLSQIAQATALINPVSSNSERGRRRLERLKSSSAFAINTVYTSSDPTETKEIIRSSLEQSDLLLVVAGDGTFNSVVRTILNNNLSGEAKQTPIWSLGGGNAEDGTKATHTRFTRRHPEKALNSGRIVSTYPICFEVTKPDRSSELYAAAFYATLGLSALLASGEYLNQEQHRTSLLGRVALTRSISELTLSLRGLGAADLNAVMTEEGPKVFFDEGFINSHLMAKYLHFPTNLTKPEVFHYLVERRRNLLSYIPTSIFDGFPDGDYLGRDDNLTFSTTHNLYAQFDGEAETIPAQSQVNVFIHDQPLRLVVSNPLL